MGVGVDQRYIREEEKKKKVWERRRGLLVWEMELKKKEKEKRTGEGEQWRSGWVSGSGLDDN
jgi:hypothetical protein